MALDLNLKITADASEAKRALADVEAGIKKVEGAAKATADPISKATSNITHLAESKTKLTTAADKSHAALQAEVMALIKGDAAAINAAKSQTGLAAATTSATAATSLGVSSMALYAGAAGALVLAGTAVVGILGVATRHYFEHSAATLRSRDALAELAKGWDSFQMIVGGSVLGREFSIVRPIEALNAALIYTGVLIAVRIEQAKSWLAILQNVGNMLPGGMGAMIGMGSAAFSDPARRITTTGAPVPVLPETLDWLAGGPSRYIAGLGRVPRPVGGGRSTTNSGIGFQYPSPAAHMGIPGGLGYQYPVGSPLFDWNSLSPSVYGMPGALPGATGYMPGGLPGGGPGFWGHGGGFQGVAGQAAYYGGYGPSAAAGAQIGAGLRQGGFGGYAAAGMGAIQAGQEIWANTSEGGAGKRALSGALSGAAAGTMILPGIGTAIGAGVGALVGAVRGWLAPTDYDKRTQQLEVDRKGAHEMLKAPGLESMWNTLGGNVPFGFDFLKTQAQNDPTRVKGYLDEMLVKTERLDEAMKKYGITWEELGDKAQQSHIDDMAKTLIQDFEVLTLAGAKTDLVIERMGDSVNDFVQAALRTGSEVPAAMKPMIERMIQMGLLTDEDGKKFEKLEDTGITFAETMTAGFKGIKDAIDHLAEALGYIPPKLNDITDAANTAGGALAKVGQPGEYAPGDMGYPEQRWKDERPIPEMHWGGLVQPYRGGNVPIIAQSGEFMMRRSAVNRIGVGALSEMNRGGSTASGIGDVYLDGHLVGRHLIKPIADEVKRRGYA